MSERVRLIRWLYGLGMPAAAIASYLKVARSSVHNALGHSGGVAGLRDPVTDYERKGRHAVAARR